MSNITKSKLRTINSFFRDFTRPVLETLVKFLDSDICKDFQFFLSNCEPVQNPKTTDNLAAYKINGYFENTKIPIIMLVPSELIAMVSDIMMGGNGKITKDPVLTEVQLNATSNLIVNITKNIKAAYFDIYKSEISFDSQPTLLTEDSDEFSSAKFDMEIKYSLAINKEKSCKISLLLNINILMKILSELKLLTIQEEGTEITSEMINNIKNIKDINISIEAELGKTSLPIKKALELTTGSIVKLDAFTDQDIKIYANGIAIGEAKVVAVEEHFGIQITKLYSKDKGDET